MTKVAIIGKGNVGSSLLEGLNRAGYDAKAVGNNRDEVRSAVADAEIVALALPFLAIDSFIETAGDLLAGKVVLDVTNSLDAQMNLAIGYTTSGAEELQKKLPESNVVKGLNTVFAAYMSTGHVGARQLTAFIAGDDTESKAAILSLAGKLGFDAVDAGPLKSARSLEPLGLLQIQLGYVYGLGPKIGFKLVHE